MNVSVIYTGRSENPPKARPSLLPLLVILFIASYTILIMLVVEQGRTIEAQRALLRDMLKDSTQLADLKGKLARESNEAAAKPAATPQKNQAEKATTNPPAAPKAPVRSESQSGAKTSHTKKEVPAAPAEDLQDVRRATNKI